MGKRKSRLRLVDLPPEMREQAIAQGVDDGMNVVKRNKYGNVRVEVGGVAFDSKAEAARYAELLAMQDAGLIQDLERQVSFTLLPDFTDALGQKVRGIEYIADFVYHQVHDGLTIVEDVKSKPTAENSTFKLKWKLLTYTMRDRPDVLLVQLIT